MVYLTFFSSCRIQQQEVDNWRGRAMMTKVDKLNQQVEATRREMYAAYERNPKDPYVLHLSQTLDSLLNELTHALQEHTRRDVSRN